MTLSAEVLKTL